MRRLYWIIAIAAAAALVVAVALSIATRPLPLSAIQYLFTVPIPFTAAGIFLLWRHPDNRSSQLLVLGTAGTMAFAALLERIIKNRSADVGFETWMSWSLLIEALVMAAGLACLALLIGLFPDGRPATTGERRFARLMWWLPLPLAVALLANETVVVEPITYGNLPPFENPIHIEALSALGPATQSMRSLLGVSIVVAVVILMLRLRRSDDTVRRQIRWVVLGSTAALLFGMAPFIVAPLLDTDWFQHGELLLSLGSFALVLIPLSMVLAIEQPKWLDTDAFISKSLTYGALSMGIFLIYGAIAAGLGLAAGTQLPLEVAIVVTAVMAFAFQPARARLQRIADRWVFGDRPSPIEAIAELDRSIADAGGDLSRHLAETVQRAARLRWAMVTIASGQSFVAGDGVGDPVFTAEIARDDEAFGVVSCGPKLDGQFKAPDEELIKALAGQTALVLSNARLAARIVQAQEAERRRLERNIHDGAQQELVALVAKLGLARARVKAGGVDENTFIELQRDAGNILRDLRDLAQGIHPSVLTDGGLVEAVEDRCSRLPIDVEVKASPGLRSLRFNDDVEGAAYFFVTEGLTNVLKHADATEARVEIRIADDLQVLVADNGTGFEPDKAAWNGLAGLTDRFAALSGDVSIAAGDGSGTVLRGRIPIGAQP
ncbi:MAG: histidine kinase [Acidimicrobiia bacterium]|nr:histidine kinase [Acidimicrobiia bacterium]